MYIELFVVAGQSVDLENALKKAVEELRGQVQRADKVRLATVKIRPDAVDQVLKLVGESPDKIPPHYRSLVNMLKKYSISRFPAVVVDGVKVGEGDVSIEEVLRAVQDRARAEFPELSALELVPPRPTPAPVQPVPEVRPLEPPPEPQKPPAEAPRPEPVRPPEPPRFAPPEPPRPPPEVPRAEPPRPPLELPRPEPQRPVAAEPAPSAPAALPRPAEASVPRQLTAVVKLVLGRPDSCLECAYFGQLTSRCFLFGFAVANPASPPCKQYVRGGG
ncbi:hypothetical protein [Pyrobaculum neutrophilum]|uniref:Thioredoxin-like fold domain-containing protein n=1 Tax=Pyrobaculum neutrophilum (strain DSM 2338 / JCM 9278 / NBRC 100436 / V24Sta) TaxID=444157 RepID=B1YA50_PYRNV|nr:hypothetical protein [Pyrobaculum neutrophilum]ACB39024.1 conserved hypothetical protein [Pyrobaculum neutrophilum V24Sta]